jgi:hypothetical protein
MWCGRGVVPKPLRIRREGAQLQIRGTWSAGPGDDQARFLADLRALRDSAAIGYDELAARAHYPSDVLKEAENGPSLPGLPILSAYVRACEGDVLDWEERWRRLNPDVPDDPDLPVRPAGASAAAVAGARAGVGVAPPDVYDPERIRAALRGDHARSEQGGRRSGDPGVSAPAAGLKTPDQAVPALPGMSTDGWGPAETSPGWDSAPDPGVTLANGNHTAGLGDRGPFDAAFTSIPEAAEPAPAEEFSWLKKSEPEARPAAGDPTWPEQSGNGRSTETADSGYGWSGRANPDITERILRHQREGLAAREQTDFWGQPLPAAPPDLRMPTAAPQAEKPVIAPASWPSAADTMPSAPAAPPAAEPAHRSAATASTQPVSTAGSPAQAATERERRQDRYFPARLLAVIVIAALIGSALVLLLK